MPPGTRAAPLRHRCADLLVPVRQSTARRLAAAAADLSEPARRAGPVPRRVTGRRRRCGVAAPAPDAARRPPGADRRRGVRVAPGSDGVRVRTVGCAARPCPHGRVRRAPARSPGAGRAAALHPAAEAPARLARARRAGDRRTVARSLRHGRRRGRHGDLQHRGAGMVRRRAMAPPDLAEHRRPPRHLAPAHAGRIRGLAGGGGRGIRPPGGRDHPRVAGRPHMAAVVDRRPVAVARRAPLDGRCDPTCCRTT